MIWAMKQNTALKILKTGRNVYLTGAPGSGKTHILNEYINYLRNHGISVGVTASTGIAATHIGGVTIHSWSGMGVKDFLSDDDISYIVHKKYLQKRFDKTRVLVIDEVSMLSPKILDNVDRVCRAAKGNQNPFGGMQVVLSGDFFQLPPITQGGSSVQFVNTSRAWKEMDIRVCYLDEQFRHEDNTLEAILNEMRGGFVSQKTRDVLASQCEKNFANGIAPTRLYAHNIDVDILNERELVKLPGEAQEFEMQIKGKDILVKSLKKSILAPEFLKLKKDAVVMFVKNNFDAGYVNGTLGIIDGFDNDGAPIVRLFSDKKITVLPVQWAVEEDGKILARAEQLPLRLAWAITIHKSQGMSMDAAEIDLSKAFVPGQGYVALSRLRTLAGLVLLGMNEMAFAVHPEVATLDRSLLLNSEKWEQEIAQFDNDKLRIMHKDFILKFGGTTDEKEIAKNKNKEKENSKDRVSTHEKTKEFVNLGLSLAEIASGREMTIGTIISHLEKLKELGVEMNFEKFKPNESDLRKIKEAFAATGDTKLSPVHRLLCGEYSYDDIRLARLFL
ncbi:MAG: AAA ATPase [Parcubacteria group bacterium GW2011_GWC1_38_17]|nr:MAG: AAA ATPase [Parcubacteria group bacterium GW2011_GWC1_38_17]